MKHKMFLSPLTKRTTGDLKAFTLVELIVVITILAILSTIGFVSYSGYLQGVRDVNRVSQLKSIHDGLELYRIKKTLPKPDSAILVKADGETIGYQGYAGEGILNEIEVSHGGLDPKDKTYFSYYITKDRKYFQLMAFLEDSDTKEDVAFDYKVPLGAGNSYAADYENRYPIVYGKSLGILTDTFNTPVHEIQSLRSVGGVDLITDTNDYIAHFGDKDNFTGSGLLLYSIINNRAVKPKQPDECPDGFVPVPGNSAIGQGGFCVAKYEMSYTDATTPDSTGGGTDWNTMHYDASKKVVSEPGKFPIADITQPQAIAACKSMGPGYHLVMNKEWMTLARNIELQNDNWSEGVPGKGYIFNGNSNDTAGGGCRDNTGGRSWATTTGGADAINLESVRSSCDEKRQLKLSNGQIVWDIAGNVREHVNKADTIDGTGFDTGTNLDISTTNNALAEWTVASSVHRDSYGPLVSSWNATNGLGRVYQADGRVFLRGGNASNGSTAGLWSLGLGWSSANQGRDVGFRCAK